VQAVHVLGVYAHPPGEGGECCQFIHEPRIDPRVPCVETGCESYPAEAAPRDRYLP
jgi:hypothetical protein